MECQMNNNNRAILMITMLILVAGLILGGCAEKTRGPPPMPEVAVVTIQLKPVVMTTELPGRTAAYLIAEVRPQVGGIIKNRLFKGGSNEADSGRYTDGTYQSEVYDDYRAYLGPYWKIQHYGGCPRNGSAAHRV